MPEHEPLDLAQLEQRLEHQMDLELNRLAPDDIASRLLPFPRHQQELALRLATVAAKGHTQIGYQVGMHADVALKLMDPSAMEAWVVHALDLYDRVGLFPAITSVKNVEQYAREAEERGRGVVLDDVSGVLSLFVRGLAGRELKIREDKEAWTDTQHVHLPPFVGRFEDKEDNFHLYKAMIVHQWAQAWFGSWRMEGESTILGRMLRNEDPSGTPLKCLLRLESIRLDHCIEAELPGIHREMRRFREKLGETLVPEGWEKFAASLKSSEADIHTSLEILSGLEGVQAPGPLSYECGLRPGDVDKAVSQRIEKEKLAWQKILWDMLEEQKEKRQADMEEGQGEPKLELKAVEDARVPEGFSAELALDAEPVPLPQNAREILKSIMQDFSQIPEEYLQAAGPGQYDATREDRSSSDVWSGTYHEEGAFFYNEWDFKRQHYRKNWCVLREVEVKPTDSGFAQRTLRKYEGLVKHIRKSFEALRGENCVLKRQSSGENIDMEALVEAWSDAKNGREMSDRLYTRLSREERSIAVMFMVDMSGSTKGWINDAERESLILLCEALETLGDRYAIYGFSGWARKRCEIFPVKLFEQDYDDQVIARIAGIQPKDYTRMGAAIRHLTELMQGVEAKTRILVTLSDGKPDDYDDYGGQYGIEDTRMALLEARRSGVHPFCITIDREGQEYLPYMYGPAAYVVVDEVKKLPFKVADIYRKLTT